MAQKTTRFNVQLDERHTMKLYELAERAQMNPGAMARSLLSTALDQAETKPTSIIEILDSIPGAFERAQQGLREAKDGDGILLAEF